MNFLLVCLELTFLTWNIRNDHSYGAQRVIADRNISLVHMGLVKVKSVVDKVEQLLLFMALIVIDYR